MEKLSHIWNVNQFMTKLNTPLSRSLQPFYIRCCKKISKGTLPRQCFGNTKMCPHCGSLWNTVDYKVRLLPGKLVSKSVAKAIRSSNKNDKKVPKVRASLIRKCQQNQLNKLIIKCSVCSRNTVIPLTKPKRLKVTNLESNKSISTQKRRKKKTKDKTAGLNVSGIVNLCKEKDEKKEKTGNKIRNKFGGNTTNFITATPKLKKLNIARLKDIVTQGTSAPKTKSLHKFLKEL